MRATGQPLQYGADGAAVAAAYNSGVYPSQQQYGPRPGASMPGGPVAHMVQAPRQPSPRSDDTAAMLVGPMKATGGGGGKGSAAATTMLQQQRSAPYPNPHRYMQSRRPQFINGQTTAEVPVFT